MLKLDMDIRYKKSPGGNRGEKVNPEDGIETIVSDLHHPFQHLLYPGMELVAITSDNYNYRPLFPPISTVPTDRPVLKNNLSSVLKSISGFIIGHYSFLNNSSESLRDKRHVELVGMKKPPIRGVLP